jgi:cation:H+ antiporter
MLDFTALGFWLNLAISAGAAVAVWMAGVRITGYANVISETTGAGQAFISVPRGPECLSFRAGRPLFPARR